VKFWKAIIIWLFLISSSAVISVAALLLLWREQQRLEQLQAQTLEQRAEAVAADISLLLDEVKLGLEQGLQQMPERSSQAQLERWVTENPYAQAAFLMRHGIVTAETEEGIARAFLPVAEEANKVRPKLPAPEVDSFSINRVTTQRQKIRAEQQSANFSLGYKSSGVARESSSTVADVSEPTASMPSSVLFEDVDPFAPNAITWDPELFQPPMAQPLQVDWRWHNGEGLQLVGIGKSTASNLAKGVVVKMQAFGRDVETLLKESSNKEVGFALMQGDAKLYDFRQINSYGEVSVLPVSLEAIHPGWELVASSPPLTAIFGMRLFTAGGLVIALLGGAILLAGTLLLWQTWLGMREARVRSGFVSTVSHELKTPLTTIRMYADMLRGGRLGDEAKRSYYLDTIVNEAERLNRLVINVLVVSRAENGGRRYNFSSLDLREWVETVVEEQRAAIENAGMQIDTRLPEVPTIVEADADALRQVMLNLIDNAIKYAADGKALSVHLTSTDKDAVLTLVDKGRGIPKALQKKVFKPFHCSQKMLTDTHSGCGLGLSIARSIVREHGGDLRLIPSSKGAVFKFTIPLKKQ